MTGKPKLLDQLREALRSRHYSRARKPTRLPVVMTREEVIRAGEPDR
ncbi:MAG: hypothetical protein M0Z56_10945 [Desulfobacteraceae bacterium]|nr:hypothetical protein [Desulfobacteraceae bacterium]